MGNTLKTKHYSDKSIADALHKSHGMIYKTAAALGCSHTTIYNRLKANAEVGNFELQEIIDHYKGARVDNAEFRLDEAIDKGEGWAIAFTLRTIGRDRGYTEHTEVEHSGKIELVELLQELRNANG